MSDEVPVATVRTRTERRRQLSLIWAIPLITACIAAWLAWDTLSKRGPEITIRFDSASGLQANQSHIRLPNFGRRRSFPAPGRADRRGFLGCLWYSTLPPRHSMTLAGA
jgi:hypothetical protein